MTGVIGYSTYGRKIHTRISFAKDLESIATFRLPDRTLALGAFFRRISESNRKLAITTLIQNHPQLLLDIVTLARQELVALAKSDLEENIDSVLQRNTVDGEALLAIGNFLIVANDVSRGIEVLRRAADMTPTRAQRDTINARVLSLVPHNHNAGLPANFLTRSDETTLIIADKSIDIAFLNAILATQKSTRLHFFADLENRHLADLVLSEQTQRSGCRDIMGRYDERYAVIASACHHVAQKVTAVLQSDAQVSLAFPGNGFAATSTLMIADHLFWGAYYVECLERIIADSNANRIVFLLGENTDLWAVATRYCNGLMADRIWYCAPSKNPAAYRLTLPRMRQMRTSWPMDQMRTAASSPEAMEADESGIGQYVRYFLQSLKNRAVTAVSKMRLPPTDARMKVHVAGGYYTNYLDSLQTVSRDLARSGYNVTVCDYGPKPAMSVQLLGIDVDAEESVLTGLTYCDLFKPTQNDIFPARLGKWLLLSRRAAIDELCFALRDDATIPPSVIEILNVQAERYFTTSIPQLAFQYYIYLAFLEKTRPSLVIFCPSRPKEAMLLAAASQMLEIKTVTLDTHILESSYARNLSIYTDGAIVISQYYADHYTNYFRVPQEAVYVAGSLRLGTMLEALQGQTRASARLELGWADSSRATLLLIGQPITWRTLAPCVDMFARALSMLEDRPRICLRLHREENAERYEQYLEIFRKWGIADLVLDGSGDIGPLILASDCIAGFFSTALIEAAAAGRAVIVIQPEAKQWIVDWSLLGLAHSARGWREIYETLRRILENPDAMAFSSANHEKDAVMQRVRAAMNDVVTSSNRRAEFTAPSDIFVKYHMPLGIVG
jgi:hypothetical protein